MKQAIQSEVVCRSGGMRGRKVARGLAAVGMMVGLLAVPARAAGVTGRSRQSGGAGGSHLHGGATRPPGYLGIGFRDISEEQAVALHLQVGRAVEVTQVDHDGPAGKAGLRQHDVIVSLNGQMVAGAAALKRMIHDSGVGASIALMVMRGGQPMTVTAQLEYRADVEKEAMERMATADVAPGSAPATGGTPVVEGFAETTTVEAAPVPAQHSPGFIANMLHTTPFTGLEVGTMEPQLAGFFGVPAGMGLLVHTVMPNSPASSAGLRAGDVVLKADAAPMKTAGDWTKHLHASKGGRIALTVVREKREIVVTIVPEFKKHAMLDWPELF